MYEGDEINSGDGGSFDRPGAIVSSSPDEQQNAAPVKTPKLPKAPKPSKVEEPAPMFFQEPAPLPVAPVRERTRSKLPLFLGIGAAVIVAVIVIVTVIIINANQGGDGTSSKIAGEVNLAGLFDPTAPIPYRGSKISTYGYIDPTTGKWTISKQFSEAGPFYGSYAKIRQNERDMIINRKGETVVTAERDFDQISYDIDENVWSVAGNDVYNGEMKKANAKDTSAAYLGHGYAFVIPDKPDENSEWQTGIPYVIRVDDGSTVYACEAIGCTVIISKGRTDSNVYVIATEVDKGAKFINLGDGKTLFSCGSSHKLSRITDGIYIETDRETNKTIKYYVVDNNEYNTSDSIPNDDKAFSISKTDKYYKVSCGSSKGFKITDADGNEVLACSTNEYWFLSKNTYKKIAQDGKEAILFQGDDGVHLYDLKEGKDIKVFAKSGNAVVYENSAFFRLTLSSGKRVICNLFELDKECVEISKNNEVTAYPTFFVVGNKLYSYDLKEITRDE